ncbi:MAG: type IV toxin-antitoxin system AbiEi family antitoxin [Actinomycetota bacterium]
MDEPYPARSLSRQEAQVVAWLEADRRRTVTVDEIEAALAWRREVVLKVLSRLARKGWLVRLARGRYETLLAETGGVALPNPWAALSVWRQQYFVGFQSAAYELGLTPDRPGDVQACVPLGARRPRAWVGIPIALIWQQAFTRAGVEKRQVHDVPVWIASPERVLVDAAARPSRVGGIAGLVRMVDRGADGADWPRVVALSAEIPRGRPALKRLAHLLDLIGAEVPAALDAAAAASPTEHPIRLGDTRVHGGAGEVDRRYGVIRNVDADMLREEVRR